MQALKVFTDVPNFEPGVFTSGREILTTSRDSQRGDRGREMSKNLDNWPRSHVGCPHQHLTIDMSRA
jgi:hypothetical protein